MYFSDLLVLELGEGAVSGCLAGVYLYCDRALRKVGAGQTWQNMSKYEARLLHHKATFHAWPFFFPPDSTAHIATAFINVLLFNNKEDTLCQNKNSFAGKALKVSPLQIWGERMAVLSTPKIQTKKHNCTAATDCYRKISNTKSLWRLWNFLVHLRVNR